jgi:hypothetical protein
MQPPGLFNPKVQQDIYLGCEGATIAEWELPFCELSVAYYLNYAFANLGIGGLFTRAPENGFYPLSSDFTALNDYTVGYA